MELEIEEFENFWRLTHWPLKNDLSTLHPCNTPFLLQTTFFQGQLSIKPQLTLSFKAQLLVFARSNFKLQLSQAFSSRHSWLSKQP